MPDRHQVVLFEGRPRVAASAGLIPLVDEPGLTRARSITPMLHDVVGHAFASPDRNRPTRSATRRRGNCTETQPAPVTDHSDSASETPLTTRANLPTDSSEPN